MGNKDSVTSVSLNYSAILYSPFEFYAMEDWKSMQKLGVIFENNLRKHKDDAIKFLEKKGEMNAKHAASEQLDKKGEKNAEHSKYTRK